MHTARHRFNLYAMFANGVKLIGQTNMCVIAGNRIDSGLFCLFRVFVGSIVSRYCVITSSEMEFIRRIKNLHMYMILNSFVYSLR